MDILLSIPKNKVLNILNNRTISFYGNKIGIDYYYYKKYRDEYPKMNTIIKQNKILFLKKHLSTYNKKEQTQNNKRSYDEMLKRLIKVTKVLSELFKLVLAVNS